MATSAANSGIGEGPWWGRIGRRGLGLKLGAPVRRPYRSVSRRGDRRGHPIWLLDSARRFRASGRRRRDHHAQTLQQQNGALRRSPPNKLATFTLAILHVNVTARILQAAILECAVYEHALIENHVLILEDLAFMSVHNLTQVPAGTGRATALLLSSAEGCCGSPPASRPASARRLSFTLRGCKPRGREIGRFGDRVNGQTRYFAC